MSLIALLLDGLAFAGYYVQNTQHAYYTPGLGLQVMITVLLLIMLFTYSGKRFGWFNFATWAHNFTFRYAIIVLSFIINAAVLALYILNATGTNSLIFQ
ncbi:hypothetical protein [Lacticaseibacillus mingshuiensis]|uniref:hypothetical protein n=1 Tax=Lacticaseibacillus mingshuiensis TaxID=2799574 RepID=UPI00195275A4|nr:hypothetical protein [Lacticaseibacillus mingshuiensis]